ncbi:MAG: esterase family protein [Bacteroidales bacterium]|nr:esterase family protein [Candidatus Sodaliphilus aphodohippi]
MKSLKLRLTWIVTMFMMVAAMANAAEQTDTVEVMSARMGRAIKCVVVVPAQYFETALADAHFPVLYLLHGADGCYSNWSQKADLNTLSTRYSTIIVCPDGQDSWYFDSPRDPKYQFETFISSELVAYIDASYRSFKTPDKRAITGLSMGGHGALFLGFRHPDVFGSCGSMSGGVDITKFPDRWLIQRSLGKYDENPQVWADHAVINQIAKIKKGQHIIIDDGSDDFFYEVNMNLHKALLDAGVPHDFTIRPGNHSWSYWVNSLDYHMLFFSKAFNTKK